MKTGKFLDLTITEAVRNDQQDAKETAGNICKNDKLYSFMTKNRIERLEMQVFIGSTEKEQVTLVIELVPEQIYQERLHRKEKEEKKKGRKTRDKTKFLLHFNLFVTNVDSEILPREKVLPLYRFRWQVERVYDKIPVQTTILYSEISFLIRCCFPLL